MSARCIAESNGLRLCIDADDTWISSTNDTGVVKWLGTSGYRRNVAANQPAYNAPGSAQEMVTKYGFEIARAIVDPHRGDEFAVAYHEALAKLKTDEILDQWDEAGWNPQPVFSEEKDR